MQTITLPKNQYEVLKKKASLYEEFLKLTPENIHTVSLDKINALENLFLLQE